MGSSPPRVVLRAFGAGEPVRHLPGGQGTSWAAGGLVLKPGGGAVHEWFADVASTIVQEGFRLALPVRTREGTWSSAGWSASRWLEGSEPDRSTVEGWQTVLAAGRAFHHAVAHVRRPDVLAARQDAWAVADRAAWGETTIDVPPSFELGVRRLTTLLAPLGPSQVVHGDLTLNVLVEPGLVPAVIDVSPYWRPVDYAEGVVVADALCWHGADRTLVEELGVPVPAVARALLFRLFTTVHRLEGEVTASGLDELDRHERAAAVLGA